MRIWHQSITALDALGAYGKALAVRMPSLVSPGTEVALHGVPADCYAGRAPAQVLRYPYARYRIHDQVLGQVVRAEQEGYDAVAFVTFAEPLLDQARALADIPVVSMLESSLLVACQLARRIALVTLAPENVARLRDQVVGHQLGSRVTDIVALAPAVDEFQLAAAFTDPATVVDAFVATAKAAVARGADAVIPAEGVLNEVLALAGVRRVDDAAVVDCVAVTMAQTEMMVALQRRIGLDVGRRWDHARVPADLMHDLDRHFGSPGEG